MKPNHLLSPVIILLFFVGWFCTTCQTGPGISGAPVSKVSQPEWSRNANIYEVNIRQYTPEGTFEAFSQHLDRLHDMGVNILWLMPVTPIGEMNRKGSLGSYYAVKDYKGINPEFGTPEDFKKLVNEIHDRGMYVIIDWVANHSAWDHPWTITNPEFYYRDENGGFVLPDPGWEDVIHLNYENPGLWDAMIDAMTFWVRDVGVDGFRCDVAYMVPVEFWNHARSALDAIKPVFMLAEAETPELHMEAFNTGYGWHFHHMMNRIAKGEETVSGLDTYFFTDDADVTSSAQTGFFPEGAYKMYFITNHDENSWAGTEFMRMGDGVEAFTVLTATIPGTVLVYSGQEAAFDRMLAFFDKDQIDWEDFRYHGFYKKLLQLKSRNRALWNGTDGGTLQRVYTGYDEQVFAFVREKENDKVFVVLNLSAEPLEVSFTGDLFTGSYRELFTDEQTTLAAGARLNMKPWGYFVFDGQELKEGERERLSK